MLTRKLSVFTMMMICLLPSGLFAQASSHTDISGTWVGTRMQYDWAKLNYVQTFDYIFELEQDGNLVSGTSFIENSSGDFAEIMIRGSVVGDKFYFEEYEVIDEDRPGNRVWCFKVGSLDISAADGTLMLDGDTESYTSIGFWPCSGGTTHLEKLIDYGSGDPIVDDPVISNPASTDLDFSLTAYPNPYSEQATIKYTIEETADVSLEVYSISGQKMATLVNENQSASTYSYVFAGRKLGLSTGAYIVKLTVGDQVASQQIIQMN